MSFNRHLQVGDHLIIEIYLQLKNQGASLWENLKKAGVWLGQFHRHLRSGLLVTFFLMLLTIMISTFAHVYFG